MWATTVDRAGVLAYRNEAYATNLGGIGTPKEKILYQLIDERTIDSVEGYELSIQLYYKTRDFRELHGNLKLTTKKLEDNTAVRFGFLYTDD
jgi:hypothetical protein